MLKAVNIAWDEAVQELPTEMIIPKELEDEYDPNDPYLEEISEWLSDATGFCHSGFEIVKEVTKESVEEELYDFFNNKMETGEAPDIERVRVFKDNLVTADNGIIIDCVGGKQIRLIIQVD